MSNGTPVFVPNTVWNLIPTRIIDHYYGYTKENNPGFSPLGRTSLLSLLHACQTSIRQSKQGINYFTANAGQAFDDLIQLIEELNLDIASKRSLIDNIKSARMYSKSDYKVNISQELTVADHCINYSLSSLTDGDFAEKCNHKHNDRCNECENLAATLEIIENEIKNLVDDRELVDRALARLRISSDAIDAWKAHLLRSVNQGLCRQELVYNLQDDTVFVYMNWAIKWLPEKYREPQENFFGKKGLSWHISVVVKEESSKDTVLKQESNFSSSADEDEIDDTSMQNDDEEEEETVHPTENNYSTKIYVHVIDHCMQDSEAVIAILSDVLKRVKTEDKSIKHAFLRVDNAGCYHSASAIFSLAQVSLNMNIKVERIDFSDTQARKSACDRYAAAVIKGNVRRYLNGKHGILNAGQFIKACMSHSDVKDVEAFDCPMISSDVITPIPLITQLNNFSFEKDGLCVHRAQRVGEGKLISWKDLKCATTISRIECNNYSGIAQAWSAISARKATSTVDSSSDDDDE
ncbi:unnamed protein product [Didymodactylos carnosus]|uniref:Uncharacterized protein n=1 Tax=Didymodactylos carnosus TaxID=1234261 RepID=A0A814P5Z1_9BILA|nr:unnamed protein product [Didymodactylos carnosus]CAF3868145.1 unnamed protein product [Didymodactylos carnosus]